MLRVLRWMPRVALLMVGVLGIFSAWADDVQVNTYTTDDQRWPAVAADADGDFVVVWRSIGSSGTDSSEWSIQGQRYASDGTAAGDEFQVNTYTLGQQARPDVAMDAEGDFVVVWMSDGSSGSDTSEHSVQGQRYASDGTAIGGEFQVNTYTTDDQDFPAVAMDEDGNFIVAWASGGNRKDIQGQRYASDGSLVGEEFQVHTNFADDRSLPAVASDTTGNFIVVWHAFFLDPKQGAHSLDIQGQRFASDGTRLGGQFQANTFDEGFQTGPAIALSDSGEFVVVWGSTSVGYPYYSVTVHGQRFASDGSPADEEFQVSDSLLYGRTPAVAMGADGDFMVAWHACAYGPENDNIGAQHYDSNGTPIAAIFQVNSYTPSGQCYPAMASTPDKKFIVVWESDGSGGSDSDRQSIQTATVQMIFADSFESGDTSAWSGTTGL